MILKQQIAKSVTNASIREMFIFKNSDTRTLDQSNLLDSPIRFKVMGVYLSRRPFVNPTEVLLFWHRLETEMGRTWEKEIDIDLLIVSDYW